MSFNKKSLTAFCCLFAVLTLTFGRAQIAECAEHKAFPIDSIVTARWIDRKNNIISLTILTFYPNGCYSLDNSAGFTVTADKKIYVSQTVNIIEGPCTMAIVSQLADTAILVPEIGTYYVIDALTNRNLGALTLTDREFSFYHE